MADTRNDPELAAGDIKHYIFQTPKAFLDRHNAHKDTNNTIIGMGISLYIVHANEVLETKEGNAWVGPGLGPLPYHNSSTTLIEHCYKVLQDTAKRVKLKNVQVMEPAFKTPFLSVCDWENHGLCLRLAVLVTVAERPASQNARMLLLESAGNKSAYPPEIFQRVRSLSKAHLLERFPTRIERLKLRMGFLLCHLKCRTGDDGALKESSDEVFYLGIAQNYNFPLAGLYLFDTTAEVSKVRGNSVGVRYSVDWTHYIIPGLVKREVVGGDVVTVLTSRPVDRPEDCFGADGRFLVEDMEPEMSEKLGKVVLEGGVQRLY